MAIFNRYFDITRGYCFMYLFNLAMGQNQSGYWPSKIQQISGIFRCIKNQSLQFHALTHPRPIPHSNAAWPRGTKANILRRPHHHQTRLGSRPLHTSSGEVWGINMKNISERKVKRWLIRINRYDTFRSDNVKNSSGTVSKKNIATETPNLFSHWTSKVHLQLPRYIYIYIYIISLLLYIYIYLLSYYVHVANKMLVSIPWQISNYFHTMVFKTQLVVVVIFQEMNHLLFYGHVSERHSR